MMPELKWQAVRPQVSGLAWMERPFWIGTSFVAVGCAAGAVIGTGNLTLAGLALGTMLGVLMLAAVQWAIWIVLVGTLIICGPILMFAPQLWRISWAFSLMGMFLSVAGVLGGFTARGPLHKGPSILLGAAGLFVLLATGSIFLPGAVSFEVVAGLKRWFQYWGVMLALAVVPLHPRFVIQLARFLVALVVLQIPFALYQRMVLVPTRWNLPERVVPIDVVTGTFEGTLDAGSANAVMAMLCCGVIAMVLAGFREGLVARGRAAFLLFAAMVPLALGETKVVLVLAPIALVCVYGDLLFRRPLAFLSGAMLVTLVLAALGWTYLMVQNTDDSHQTLEQRVAEALDYNVGDVGYGGGATLNRTTVFSFWWQQHRLSDPVPMLLGHGLGSTYPSDPLGARGHLEQRYSRLGVGLTTASILLWELGLIGATVYAGLLGLGIASALRLARTAKPGADRAMCRTLAAMLAMALVMLLHNDYAAIMGSMQVLTALALGLTARRMQRATPGVG
jgi:hypothetical protein